MENKHLILENYIKDQLNTGKIKPGEKLPSVRTISAQFGCSINTVIHAYDSLKNEKMLYSVPKSGYYAHHDFYVNPSGHLDPSITPYYDYYQLNYGLHIVNGSFDAINFAATSPDPAITPYHDFYQCLNYAIELYQEKIFTYNIDPIGFMSLRTALEQHLATYQVFAQAKNIAVVSGVQQMLHLLSIMQFPNGKSTVLVEQPSYSRMLNSLTLNGTNVIGITRTRESIDLKDLELHFRKYDLKFFYTIPRFHPSLGTSLSVKQKKQIAILAEKYDVYIVEDDYLADLEINSKSDPIYSYDTSEHTIYMKSFSKILSPGLRLAAVVLPKKLLNSFQVYKLNCDMGTSALSQAALEIFLTNGMFERHLTFIRKEYLIRQEELRKACDLFLPRQLEVDIPEGGIFSRISFPKQIPNSYIIKLLNQKNILVDSTDPAFLRTSPKDNSIRISILKTNPAQINTGVRELSELSKFHLRHK